MHVHTVTHTITQSRTHTTAGMFRTLAHTHRRFGITQGLFRGFTISAIAIGGYKALYLG